MGAGRTSHEVRGLKCDICDMYAEADLSHLTRGAWIEIRVLRSLPVSGRVAPHTRCVD